MNLTDRGTHKGGKSVAPDYPTMAVGGVATFAQ